MTQNLRVDWISVGVLAIVIGVVCTECMLFGPWPAARNNVAMIEKQITSPEDFNGALQNHRLILHIDVDWSGQAVHSRPVVLRFIEAIQQDDWLAGIVFRRIDCTEQHGELWNTLKAWFDEQGADRTVMVSGYGAIVWVTDGKVVASIHYAANVGVENLVKITRDAFQIEKPTFADRSQR